MLLKWCFLYPLPDISELTRAPLDFAKLGITKSFEDMTLFEVRLLSG